MKQKTGRKLLGFLLALAMAVGLLPGMSSTAYAEGDGTEANPIEITSWTSLSSAMSGTAPTGESVNSPTYYKLTQNVEATSGASAIPVGEGRHVVLDLNGKTIDRNLTSAIDGGHVIKVEGNLTIKDGATGGKITGGYDSDTGGGVYVSYGAKFTMKGGTISGNTAEGNGAGVFVDENAEFTMEGGTISGNTAEGNGGGVQLPGGATFNMKGGTISGNTAKYYGGGVNLLNGGVFCLSGMPIIKDNKIDDKTANVHISAGTIKLTGALESGASVGVTMKNPGVFTSSADPIKASGYKDCFSSDDSTYTVTTDGNELKLSSHEHDFTYSATGATITATCTVDGCTLSANPTLTINAPTMTAYSQIGEGISANATLTGLDDFNTATGKTIAATDIKYVGRDGTLYEESATAPTNAGKYTAKITVEEKTASVDYEITKADPTTPTGLTATYGQTLADVTLPDGWTWADSTQSVGSVVSPAATFKANFAGNDNYNAASNVDVAVTVSKAANPAAVTSTATVTNGGNTVYLARNIALNGATGEVTYAINGEANGCTLNGSVLTSGDNTGYVTVNVSVAADDNYNALAATPITVTISDKGTQTITASDVTATYGDTGKSVIGTTTGDGAISYSVKSGDAVTVDENTGALTIVKAGSAVITVTAAETATYAQATKDVNVTVNTKAMTVSAENVNVTVDGQPHGITVNVTAPASGATVKYGTEVGTYNLDASPTQTEAGELTVYYQVTADNYTTYTGSAKVTVNAKQTQTITASNVTATYGDTDKKISATTNGNGAISYAVKDGSADYIDVDASTGALTIKKVGTATVIVTAAETATYEQATKEVTVTINKANAVAATVTANNRTYDGTEKPLVAVSGTPTGGTMQYALGTATKATEPYTASIPTATNAGTYYVWYKVVGDANHNDSEARCVTATVTKKAEPEPTPDATVGRVTRPSTEASPARKTIDVSWKAASGAESYQVQWRKAGASKWTSKSVKGRKYTIKGLKRGTAYQVRVRGVAGSAKGDWSKASSRWLKAASKVRAATGKKSGTVKVSWAGDAKANAGCRVYVYARQGGKPIKTIEVAKGKAAATVKGLKPGKAYHVRVRPYRRASGTTFSGAISGYRAVRAAK